MLNPVQRIRRFIEREAVYKRLKVIKNFLLPDHRDIKFTLKVGGGSFTDGKQITVGIPESLSHLSDEGLLAVSEALDAHECQHDLSSDFNLFVEFQKTVSAYLKKNRKIDVRQGMKIAKHIFNSVEDGRIEKILSNRSNGLKKKIQFLNGSIWEIQPIKGQNELGDFLYTITCISVTGLYPKDYSSFWDKTELDKNIQLVKNDIFRGINAVSCKECFNVCWDIVKKIEPYLEKLLSSNNEDNEEYLSQIPQDAEFTTSNEREYNSSRTVTSHFKPEPQEQDEADEVDEENEDTSSQEQTPEDGDFSDKQNTSKDSSQSQKEDESEGEEEDSDEEEESSGGGSQNQEDEESSEEEDSQESDGSSSNDSEDLTEDEESSGGGSQNQEDEESSEDDSKNSEDLNVDDSEKSADDETSGKEESQDEQGEDLKSKGSDDAEDKESDEEENEEDSQKEGQGSEDDSNSETPQKTAEQESETEQPETTDNTSSDSLPDGNRDFSSDEQLVKDQMREITQEVLDEAKENLKEQKTNKEKKEESQKLSQSDVEEIDNLYKGQIYRGFKEIKGFPLAHPLTPVLKRDGTRFRKEIERIFINKQTLTLKSQKRGVFDVNDCWKFAVKDYNLFMQKGTPVKSDYVAYILADRSGSMTQDNKELFSTVALSTIEEGLKGIIPFKITAFTVDTKIVHYVIKDFNENDRSYNYSYNYYKYRTASGGNKDGYSIRVATRELEKRPEKDKILIILSDGLPSDYDRGEEEGMTDVKNAVKEARSKGILVISMLFGTESFRDMSIDNYKFMYEKNIISCAPEAMRGQLVKLLTKIMTR